MSVYPVKERRRRNALYEADAERSIAIRQSKVWSKKWQLTKTEEIFDGLFSLLSELV
jgi:hypothetical protein